MEKLIIIPPLELGNNENILITSKYGERKVRGRKGFHHGLDLVKTDGKNKMVARIVNPFEKAVVLWTKNSPSAGKTVILLDMVNSQRDCRVFGVFCHLDLWYDEVSSVLSQGEVFAMMGNTGRSYGAHLHFGLALVEDKDFTDLGKLLGGFYSVDPQEYGL